MTNISKAQKAILRDKISRLLNAGLSHSQIIDQLQISKTTFYQYLKDLRDIEVEHWSKVEIDSSRYRALALLRSFEDTVRICSQIANSGSTSNKDRIEARKAVDLANAHIFRLVNEGTMFKHLPEVTKYIKIQQQEPQQLTDESMGTDNPNTISYTDSSNIDNNINNNNNNNIINTHSSFDSSQSDSAGNESSDE